MLVFFSFLAFVSLWNELRWRNFHGIRFINCSFWARRNNPFCSIVQYLHFLCLCHGFLSRLIYSNWLKTNNSGLETTWTMALICSHAQGIEMLRRSDFLGAIFSLRRTTSSYLPKTATIEWDQSIWSPEEETFGHHRDSFSLNTYSPESVEITSENEYQRELKIWHCKK